MIESKYGHRVQRFADMRAMFERPDIDVYWVDASFIGRFRPEVE